GAVAHYADGVVRSHLHQPGIYGIGGEKTYRWRRGDLDHVVKDVAMSVCTQRRGRICIRIDCGPKGIDALHHRAIRLVDLEDRSPFARIVKKAVSKHGVINRLPEIAGRPGCIPIRVKRPDFDKVAALPRVFVLMPPLAAVGSGAVRSVLGFDIDVTPVDQRDLVVDEKIAFRDWIGLLLSYIEIVDDV